jgi:hypothetical protein
LARVDAGVLDERDIVDSVKKILTEVLSEEVISKLRAIWKDFQNHQDHANALPLYDLTREFLKVLDERKEETGEESGEEPGEGDCSKPGGEPGTETGTGKGECLSHALQYPFKNYYTVDIDEELVEQVYKNVDNYAKDINLLVGKSTDILEEYVPQIPQESPVLFFLDAHFPGADFHKCTYEESIREHMKDAFPLEEEVQIISKNRDVSKDVFIIDDFILYEEGDYDCINYNCVWEYGWLQEELDLKTNSQFLYDMFEKTHDLTKDLRSQGYLIITPKK